MPADPGEVSVEAPPAAAATPDVLPSGVRRRLGPRDAGLAAILVGELLLGVGAHVAWDARHTLASWSRPRPLPVSAATVAAEPPVVVAAAATPSPAPPAPRRTVPRNPFAVQLP